MVFPRIAVIDDDPNARQLLAEVLTIAGYTPVVFADGASALVALRAEPPALILLDYEMPGLHGRALLGALHGDPRTEAIPVILVTGSPDVPPTLPGVTTILRKPFRLEVLAKAVRTALAPGAPPPI